MRESTRLTFVGLAVGLALVVVAAAAGLYMPPAQAQVVFATNTPPVPTVDPLDIFPEGPLEQYALRLWQESDLIDVLASQLARLAAGEDGQALAIRLTQYELERRFPGAPHRADQRQRLLNLMLTAPRGTVDMRAVVRATLIDHLNQRQGSPPTFIVNGFWVETMPVDLDGSGPDDLYMHIRYPDSAQDASELLYEDFLLLRGVGDERYALPAAAPDFPAAPFGAISSVSLGRLDDLNRDGLDELAVIVNRGDVNEELLIFGWRAGQVISLVQPGERILFGDLLDWPLDRTTIQVASYRLESARWNCMSALEVTWSWSANFFRPSLELNAAYVNLDTPGCQLHESEPIFAQPAPQAISVVANILESNDDPTAPGMDRAGMALAMLYLLNDQADNARRQVETLIPLTENNPWLAGQVAAFANNTIGDNFTAVEVCAALVAENPDGACEMDQVLTQLFVDNPIARDEPLVAQLEALGLPVLEVVTVSAVGRADRQVVNFNLAGASWWAFAPTSPGFFVPSPVPPPPGYEPASFPVASITPPPAAYDALLLAGDVTGALNALESVIRANPGVPLSPAALYFQALGYDLLADRQNARRAYYDLWTAHPDNLWGLLAGAHLESRIPSVG